MRKIKPSPGQKNFPFVDTPPPQRPDRTSADKVIRMIEKKENPHDEPEIRESRVHLRNSIHSGRIMPATDLVGSNNKIVNVMRQERRCLMGLVNELAHGSIISLLVARQDGEEEEKYHTRVRKRQDMALKIWDEKPPPQDIDLAKELESLGLCDKSEKLKKFFEVLWEPRRIALGKFRRAMRKWNEAQGITSD